MKTKRRHELQTNQLADWLGKKMQAIKPYTQTIVGVTIVVGLLVGVIVYFAVRSKSQSEAEWAALTMQLQLREQNADDLKKVSESFPETEPGLWALLKAGDVEFNSGANELLYGDRATAMGQLQQANSHYRAALKGSSDYPMIHRRATFGLGATFEALGELDKAREQFKALADNAGSTAIGEFAQRRLDRLGESGTEEFYAEFANYVRPEDKPKEYEMADLPERPDISFPGDTLPLAERPEIDLPELDELLKGDSSEESGEKDEPSDESSDGESTTTPPSPDDDSADSPGGAP